MSKLIAAAAGVLLFVGLTAPAFASSGGATSVAVTAGSGLTISGAAPGTFSATLTGSDQTVATTLGTYTAADTTGTGHGWNVTFQASQFTCTAGTGQCPAGGDTLPTSSLLMAPETVACNSGTSCSGRASAPTISIAANTALDSGSAVKVASAALNKGMGTYTFTPGTLGGAGNALTLAVPSYAYATTYNSTLTVSVVSGP